MNPMLKYRGGKSREIPLFIRYVPAGFDRYIEPFLGGGAVYFHLAPRHALINDINERLIGFYQDVRNHYDQMRIQLDALRRTYERNQLEYKQRKARHPHQRVENENEALYYSLRDMYNRRVPSLYMEGVLYYFINKTAYSGMIRYNAKGEYNVPYGRYPGFNTKMVTEAHAALLRQAQVCKKDYAEIFAMAGTRDFMFLDPPYDCTFHDYGNVDMLNGFDEAHHRRLAADFRNLPCRALMVIGKTPLTEALYQGMIQEEYSKTYAVNIRNRFKADARHIIVANYKIP